MQVYMKNQGLKSEYANLEANISQKLRFSEWAEQEEVKINLDAFNRGGVAVTYSGSIAGLIKRLS